jgi:hypothetical protein
MCKNFKEKGNCKYGPKCLFAHGEHELSVREEENIKIKTEDMHTTSEHSKVSNEEKEKEI